MTGSEPGMTSRLAFGTRHVTERLAVVTWAARGMGGAAAVAWLCGPDSGALTGAVIPVDAGPSA